MLGFLAIATVGTLGVALGLAFAAALIIYNAWAVATMWNWYAVPFFGAPTLSIPMAIGLIALASWAKGYRQRSDEEAKKALIYELVQPGLLVLIAWVAKFFVG